MILRASAERGPGAVPSAHSLGPQTRKGIKFLGGVHYPRSINYLGQLGSKLRDLRGFSTLAHELIQNADDAEGATSMAFDFRPESLVVDNDGVFTDCGDLRADGEECPRVRTAHAMCDFHRFMNVAAGDKRNEEKHTAGAFGIGFTAVYQITDHPELISAGRHWILDETQPEDRRISECPGCPECVRERLPGTRFILPWARDATSEMRRRLTVEPVDENPELTLSAELKAALSTAMLFLEKLTRITVSVPQQPPVVYERVADGDRLLISDGQEVGEWLVLRSDFKAAAEKLREEHPLAIDAKRQSVVSLAISLRGPVRGLFCAFLPTQEHAGLPFHVNADFFPSSDRKRILLDDDARSHWNRAAITEAAVNFSRNVPGVTKMVGVPVWQLFDALKSLDTEAASGSVDPVLRTFWGKAKPAISAASTVLTSEGDWRTPDAVRILQDRDEEQHLDLLRHLEVVVVSPTLRPAFGLLQEVGVRTLDAARLVEAMHQRGLNVRTEMSDLPPFLDLNALRRLRGHFEVLLSRERSGQRPHVLAAVASCTLMPSSDGAVWPPQFVYMSNPTTSELFSSLRLPGLAFADTETESEALTSLLCPKFGVVGALSALSVADETTTNAMERDAPRKLLAWFERSLDGPPYDEDIRAQLSALPLFPSSTGLSSLDSLSLPGGFSDPLGLSDVVDVQRLQGKTQFLADLGAAPLTFARYARQYLVGAFGDSALPKDKRAAALAVLSEHYHQVDTTTRDALRRVPFIPCNDGVDRAPDNVHMGSEENRRVLGAVGHFAALPPGIGGDPFLLWAGVHADPSPESVRELLEQTTRGTPVGEDLERVETLLGHLSRRLARESTLAGFEFLRTYVWLPAKGDVATWHRPGDVYATYSEHLFASQARFLGVRNQNTLAGVLDFIAVPKEPTVRQVVKHLQKCAETGERVNREVYRRLNENATDVSIKALRGADCLLTDSGYVSPDMVFWGSHPFGRFRFQLSPDLRSFFDLLDALGVREGPEAHDAAAALADVAASSAASAPLDDDDLAVVMECWRLLSEAIETDTPVDLSGLRERRVIPDQRRMLNPPERMLFDDRVGLASKFGAFLENNILPRPHVGWRGMAAAGVRSLSTEVITEVVEREDPRPCEEVQTRVLSRVELIRRVLGAEFERDEPGLGLETLDFREVSSLQVVHRLRIFGGRSSEPESVDAHLDEPLHDLYIRRNAGRIPWGQVARELAKYLDPNSAVATLASGVKEALAPEDFGQAEGALDDLGFPRATSTELLHSTALARELSALGVEGEPGNENESETQPKGESTAGDARPTERDGDGVSGEEQQPEPTERRQTRTRKKGRLRSYVVRGEEPSTKERPGVEGKRDFVDQCGIDRVIAFEEASHRQPEVMALNHPGFDILSRGEHEDRYIEVKSVSDRWGDDGVALSSTQFDEARTRGAEYWLYVVEFATAENFVIHRICDPASSVDQYFFDSGWSALDDE